MAATAGIIAAAAAVGSTAYQISQGKPKTPTPVQATKDPNVDAFRRQNSNSLSPGGALAGISSTAAGGTAGSGGTNIGSSTLLGQ